MCLRQRRKVLSMAALDDLLPLGTGLERSYPVYVRGRLKFRVKQIVYVAFSLDETVMGFAFPKEERAALVASEAHKFHAVTIGYALQLGPRRPCRAGADRGPSWSSTLGAWSCPRRSPVPTISRTPTDRAEPRRPDGFRPLNWRGTRAIGADPRGSNAARYRSASGNIVRDLARMGLAVMRR